MQKVDLYQIYSELHDSCFRDIILYFKMSKYIECVISHDLKGEELYNQVRIICNTLINQIDILQNKSSKLFRLLTKLINQFMDEYEINTTNEPKDIILLLFNSKLSKYIGYPDINFNYWFDKINRIKLLGIKFDYTQKPDEYNKTTIYLIKMLTQPFILTLGTPEYFKHICLMPVNFIMGIVEYILKLKIPQIIREYNKIFINVCRMNNRNKLIKMFIDYGVNPSIRNNEALIASCESGNTECVELLLNLPIEMGIQPSTQNYISLLTACYSGHIEIVKLFLNLPPERRVDLTHQNNYRFLSSACSSYSSNSLEIVKLLLEHGANPACNNNEPIVNSCIHGNIEIAKLLLSLPAEVGIDPLAQNNSCIISASSVGNVELVKMLLDRGADPSVENNLPFILACSRGKVDIVKFFLSLPREKGIVPSADNNKSLINACIYGHIQIIRILLKLPAEYGIDPSVNNNEIINILREKTINKYSKIIKLITSHPRFVSCAQN